ncbi:MAG TPA: UDP-N-acetylmuramate dehydrogenase [Segetibacter sp.]|jgi:UDP-N-acetylmuramate dehydrogenase
MQIQQNISLKDYNTFGIDATAKSFATFQSFTQLDELVEYAKKSALQTLILGGGSNVLFTNDFDGLVLRNEMKGIEVVAEDEDFIYVRAAAGENWHEFVLYCIKNNYAGVENLSLIPGNIGASPMQNIGAYGVEIKEVFHALTAYHIGERKEITFSASECEFGYRESVFKRKYKGQFVITTVTFKLNKKPVFNTSYGAIQQELDTMGVKELSIAAISQAVINIRLSKLPDPKKIGNAGSFFKNPAIPKAQFENLQVRFSTIVGYPAKDNQVKVAAGWLIEQCGWKGYRKGDAGCHKHQALVLVNYGKAKGFEVYNLSSEILQSVEEKFGIILEREVNII